MPARTDWLLTAFISCELFSPCPPRAKKPGGYYSGDGEHYPYKGEEGYIAEELCVHLLFNYNGFRTKVNYILRELLFANFSPIKPPKIPPEPVAREKSRIIVKLIKSNLFS